MGSLYVADNGVGKAALLLAAFFFGSLLLLILSEKFLPKWLKPIARLVIAFGGIYLFAKGLDWAY